jgi:hypothetical protein
VSPLLLEMLKLQAKISISNLTETCNNASDNNGSTGQEIFSMVQSLMEYRFMQNKSLKVSLVAMCGTAFLHQNPHCI